MKISKISEPDRPSARQLALFLSRYSACLLGAGATCIRMEKNVARIAEAYGKEAELTIMPRHIHISIHEGRDCEVTTTIATVKKQAINFNLNSELSKLSWEIADRRIGFDKAIGQFDILTETCRQHDKWLVMLLVAIANASFCRLFGGDAAAMAVVGIATLAGYYLKISLLEKGTDQRLTWIACSFVSTILGASCQLFAIGSTPDIAIATSVLYLVPGIPFINSFSDLIYQHYLCSLSRFADAMVLTCCLSAGMCAGMMLMEAGMF